MCIDVCQFAHVVVARCLFCLAPTSPRSELLIPAVTCPHVKVLGPSGRADDGRRRRLRRAAPVARVDGAPRGGAQVHRAHAALWAASIMLTAAASHNFTFAIQLARTMDRHLTPSFQIPPATMIIFTPLTMLVSLALYDRAFVPLARRYTGRWSGLGRHLLPAHGRRLRGLRPRRHGRRARGDQAWPPSTACWTAPPPSCPSACSG